MKRRNFIQGGLSALIGIACGVKVVEGGEKVAKKAEPNNTSNPLEKAWDDGMTYAFEPDFIPNFSYITIKNPNNHKTINIPIMTSYLESMSDGETQKMIAELEASYNWSK